MKYSLTVNFNGSLADLLKEISPAVVVESIACIEPHAVEAQTSTPTWRHRASAGTQVTTPPPEDAVGYSEAHKRKFLTPAGIAWLHSQFALGKAQPTLANIAKTLGMTGGAIYAQRNKWLINC